MAVRPVEDVVAAYLGAVSVSRVFDFIGMVEVVDEVRRECEESRSEDSRVGGQPHGLRGQRQRTEVGDSEDEDQDDEDILETIVRPPRQDPQKDVTRVILVDTITNLVSDAMARNKSEGK